MLYQAIKFKKKQQLNDFVSPKKRRHTTVIEVLFKETRPPARGGQPAGLNELSRLKG